jgi:hypothetical protein
MKGASFEQQSDHWKTVPDGGTENNRWRWAPTASLDRAKTAVVDADIMYRRELLELIKIRGQTGSRELTHDLVPGEALSFEIFELNRQVKQRLKPFDRDRLRPGGLR